MPHNPIRAIIVPDPGYMLVEGDLSRADLQVVVWEAGDEDMKEKLRAGKDIHMENAKDIFGPSAGPAERQLAKAGVHATNYSSSAKTLATTLGISHFDAERFQACWFAAHPGVRTPTKDWEKRPCWWSRIMRALKDNKPIKNIFGYQIKFQDRPTSSFKHALAWVGQSTVALVTNKGWKRAEEAYPEYQVLIQNHDALLFQVPIDTYPACLGHIRECMTVKVPYDDPLYIGVDFKVSRKSWGDMEEVRG